MLHLFNSTTDCLLEQKGIGSICCKKATIFRRFLILNPGSSATPRRIRLQKLQSPRPSCIKYAFSDASPACRRAIGTGIALPVIIQVAPQARI
jgi:hypothetical protein